ncbi:MAG TPA: hypothetical protein VLJ17_04280, partial [Xanthobacteraceae bacterium]|nr:hypothetical protein [Xanthobacteraceae bacterium]
PTNRGVQRIIRPQPPTFLEQLMSSGGDDDDAQVLTKQDQAMLAALPDDVRHVFHYAQLLDGVKRGDVLYLLPFDLRIR